MTRLEARREYLKQRQHDLRMRAIEIGEKSDPKAWARHLKMFCRFGHKRRAVERKMIMRREHVE